jgi:putative DNA primase/helicase
MEPKKPFHETVAETLIEQLKQGTAPWQKPWRSGESGAFLPINPITGKRYKGINAIHLMGQGHTDQRWMTYKQAAAVDAHVRKGQKGAPIQYWKFSEAHLKTDVHGKPVLDAKGEPVMQTLKLERPRVFFATVFNAEQIDGLPPLQARKQQDWSAIERTEQILHASGAVIQHGARSQAFYRPATDSIHLPGKGQFPAADHYYATALHELGHWTGHASRLGRDLVHPFGSAGYAKEELRAEIASMILGDTLGIGHDPGQHAAYVGSWIKALEDDPLEIFRAAAEAEKIQAYVLGLEHQQIQTQSPQPSQTVNQEASMQKPTEVATLSSADGDTPVLGAKTYIDVPFKHKQAAKDLGAKWDRQAQSWYVPAKLDPAPFAKWAQGSADKTPADAPKAAQPQPQADTPKPRQKRQYLAVPYGDHVAARAAGALWDKAAKSWFAGPQADRAQLERWSADKVPIQQGPAMTPQQEFAEALLLLGCVLDGAHPIMDGDKHRIAVTGDKKGEQAGFYVGHLDGHPAGYIKNNKTGNEMKWKFKGYTLDPEQKAQLEAEAAAKLQVRAAEQAQRHELTAQRLILKIAELMPVMQPTPYMIAKGVEPRDSVLTNQDGQQTYIPATDANGKLWTLQYIQADGTKRFAKDSRKEGCFHAVGGLDALANAPALVISEGYATASSLSQSLGFATVAAFDSGNLAAVAKALHAKFPDKPVVIAGDDDQHVEDTQGINPGRSKAQEAAKAVGGKALLPIFAPGEQAADPKGFTDFNDLATKSKLGQQGIDRQVQPIVESMIAQHEARHIEAQKQDRQQRLEQHRATRIL